MHRLTPFLVALLLFAPACGGGDESSQADGEASLDETGEDVGEDTGSLDAAGGGSICALLGEQELQQLLGGTVVDRRGADIEEGGNCFYTAASGETTLVHVYYNTENFDADYAYEGALDLSGEPVLDDDGTEPAMVDGLGDKAFVDGNEIHVIDSGKYLSIAAGTEDAAILETVARAVLPRL